jgi:hypothetical protein
VAKLVVLWKLQMADSINRDQSLGAGFSGNCSPIEVSATAFADELGRQAKSRTRRRSEPEPAGSRRYEQNASGGWLKSLTYVFGDTPHMSLPANVVAEINRRLHSRDRQAASQLLEGCVMELSAAEREKVLLNMVRLAGRHMDKLLELVEVAKQDYRNLEYWHGFPEESRERFFQQERREGEHGN